jgi:hypothetical protein
MAQVTCNVLMVRPRHFGHNAETATSNAFQNSTGGAPLDVHQRAITEFDGMVGALRAGGVRVHVCEDSDSPVKPDAVFPNNWVTFHDNGDVILYPMHAANRRSERRLDIVEEVARRAGFPIRRVLDLSWLEERGAYLEATGSLVLDRPHNVAFAALSGRTQPAALAEFARQTGFETVAFETRDESGRPIYHTNVILSIGRQCAVVCGEAMATRQDRERVLGRIALTGRRIIDINLSQARRFAANVLELGTGTSRSRMIMSTTARDALTTNQLQAVAEYAQPLAVPLATIERVGGGGARCMLAEIFLPELA